MRNSNWCGWSLPGGKSSAHDTEADVRQFAARRILAIPSLTKMLLPTRTVVKDFCLRILLSRQTQLFELNDWLCTQSVFFSSRLAPSFKGVFYWRI
jgi:hypothetical protein